MKNVIHASSVQTLSSISYDMPVVVHFLKSFEQQIAIRVANSYFSTIDNEQWIAADNMAEAIELAREWIDLNCFEHWKFCGGDIATAGGDIVGILSQNTNRISRVGECGNDCYQNLPAAEYITTDDALRIPPNEWFDS